MATKKKAPPPAAPPVAPRQPLWMEELQGDPLGEALDNAVSLFNGSLFDEPQGLSARRAALTDTPEPPDADSSEETPSGRGTVAVQGRPVDIKRLFFSGKPKSKPVEPGAPGPTPKEAPPTEGEPAA